MSETSTLRWTFEEDVLHYRALGFGAIGVWRYKLQEYGEAKAVELLQEARMQVSSLQWAGGFTGSEGRSYRESLLDALDAIDTAAELNANCLVLLSGGRGGHTRSHARRMLKDALKELGEAAHAKNVQLAIEPMHIGCGQAWTFLNELPETLDFVAELDLPNLGIVFDAYHMAHDDRIELWLASFARYIRLVQMGDAKSEPVGEQNRCALGEGRLRLNALIKILEASGYRGFYEVELLGEDVEHVAYDLLLRHSVSALAQWMDVSA